MCSSDLAGRSERPPQAADLPKRQGRGAPCEVPRDPRALGGDLGERWAKGHQAPGATELATPAGRNPREDGVRTTQQEGYNEANGGGE